MSASETGVVGLVQVFAARSADRWLAAFVPVTTFVVLVEAGTPGARAQGLDRRCRHAWQGDAGAEELRASIPTAAGCADRDEVVSSFIDPDRSTTKAISRGLAIATADAS